MKAGSETHSVVCLGEVKITTKDYGGTNKHQLEYLEQKQ